MKTTGWIIHYVFEDEGRKPFLNAHTHGLPKKYGHVDLQVALGAELGVSPGVVHGLMWAAVRKIEKGEVFADGSLVSEIMDGYEVKFVARQENRRTVLRMLLPDKEGLFPGDVGCTPSLAGQGTYRT